MLTLVIRMLLCFVRSLDPTRATSHASRPPNGVG